MFSNIRSVLVRVLCAFVLYHVHVYSSVVIGNSLQITSEVDALDSVVHIVFVYFVCVCIYVYFTCVVVLKIFNWMGFAISLFNFVNFAFLYFKVLL